MQFWVGELMIYFWAGSTRLLYGPKEMRLWGFKVLTELKIFKKKRIILFRSLDV
ncbi:hypothetical protein HanPSC8_Chr12g0526511 [Helianthus annuus]|nr:hypothetical protein HanPSC8_Chr12g0526511 [Helianthus annuus]